MALNPAVSQLQQDIENKCHVNLNSCLQCGCCTGGCTGLEGMDYSPRQVIQLIKLGDRQKLLNSSVIWLCASCHICEDRCPAGISIPDIMDTLREMAVCGQIGLANAQFKFHRLFLWQVANFSRLHEGLLAFSFSAAARMPLPEIRLMLKMLTKGRVDLKPPRIPSRSFKRFIAGIKGRRGTHP